jgi:cytidylate kinase
MMEMQAIRRAFEDRAGHAPVVITLDGAAGTGKTSLARSLASGLGFKFLDTGAMYRSIAFWLGEGTWRQPSDWLEKQLNTIRFSLSGSGETTRLVLDGEPVDDAIRREEVGMWASHLARLSVVRKHLTRCQQELGNDFSLVAEGRDMGSVVFPGAQFKYFLQADPEERAKRRLRQIREEYGQEADLKDIRKDLEKRDRQDSDRAIAPLSAAEDAVCLDTTDKNFDQVLSLILEDIQARLLPSQDSADLHGRFAE